MPQDSGLTDAILVKLFHLGRTDNEIAGTYGITKQAVSKRRLKLGLERKPVSQQVNGYLAHRWAIWAPQEGTGHHNQHSAKALRAWLRWRLGDTSLSKQQLHLAQAWAEGLQERGEVLCYNPDLEEGWYYRPRRESDGRRAIDWPEDLPFPDEKFKRALDLPPAPQKESV
ncbi:immunity repressor [Streptomyces phage Ibantik]|uniref:Immunity repressor n=1 Tax=Streptomyces phage Ibantik TaxID=2182397 RepID=A0A2U8UNF6_9CAUD|nr:immunity repressor [Streptomyces phage Ibantik]AWN05279.1 immunity repressor [Streptomyces phage Ibantik]